MNYITQKYKKVALWSRSRNWDSGNQAETCKAWKLWKLSILQINAKNNLISNIRELKCWYEITWFALKEFSAIHERYTGPYLLFPAQESSIVCYRYRYSENVKKYYRVFIKRYCKISFKASYWSMVKDLNDIPAAHNKYQFWNHFLLLMLGAYSPVNSVSCHY